MKWKRILVFISFLAIPWVSANSSLFHHHHHRHHDTGYSYGHQPIPMDGKIQRFGRRTFVFDPKRLQWGAYNEEGVLINSGRASGGKGYCPDVHRRCKTPIGTFSVHSKGPAGCYSSKFPVGRGGAPMPYCMFFYHGFAIHGSYDVPNYNASHGCIRVIPDAARWLNHNFMQYGTTVIVRPY